MRSNLRSALAPNFSRSCCSLASGDSEDRLLLSAGCACGATASNLASSLESLSVVHLLLPRARMSVLAGVVAEDRRVFFVMPDPERVGEEVGVCPQSQESISEMIDGGAVGGGAAGVQYDRSGSETRLLW